MATITVQANPTFINHAGVYNHPVGVGELGPSGFENNDFFVLPVKDFTFLAFGTTDASSTHYSAIYSTPVDFFQTPNMATNTVEYLGNNFSYSALGLSGGTITDINVNIEGNASYSIHGVSIPVSQISAWSGRLDDARVTEYFSTLFGGDDTIVGSSMDDRFALGAGNDTIIGNDGTDVAKYSGIDSAYTIVRHGDGSATVSDSIPSRDGSDTLFDVEQLAFSNRTIDVASLPITPGTLVRPVFRFFDTHDPVFRFFDTHDGGHFFTTSAAERDQVLATRRDMNFEGVGYNAVDPASADPNAAPVYRFFETTSGGHFFTTSAAERDQVQMTRADMKFEGVGYSEHTSQQAGDAPVYRFFETTSGGHFFTASAAERDTVQATRSDMRFEGIAFFAPT